MKQAMIFAAGLGTRLKPLTDTMPKALVPIDGRPLLEHVVNKLRQAGFEHIVINVHHFAQQIIDYVEAQDRWGLDVRISDETDQLLETGGGIKHARQLFDPESPILIHNVDILSNVDLAAFYESAAHADAALLVSARPSKRQLLFNPATMALRGWTNTETGELRGPIATDSEKARTASLTPLAFSGIHVFSPRLFPLMNAWPERFPIIDFYLQACSQRSIIGINHPTLKLMDVGKLNTLAEAEHFAQQLATGFSS